MNGTQAAQHEAGGAQIMNQEAMLYAYHAESLATSALG